MLLRESGDTSGGAGLGDDADLPPPDRIDEYEIVRPIGRGGMGRVFLAHDSLLERAVAIKFIAVGDPSRASRQRFLAEARALARLTHPNVLGVHRVGEVDGRPFLVTELVRGQSLRELATPIPWQEAVALVIGVARGLSAAHRQGVLHRDIKPANVMKTPEGEVKLIDFGLAEAVMDRGLVGVSPSGLTSAPAGLGQTASHQDGSGDFEGTPLYMAPEALRGEQTTRQSDIYALGALVYHLCSGSVPRQSAPMRDPSGAYAEWLLGRADVEHPLGESAPSVEPRLSLVVQKAMAFRPEDRHASVDQLREALEELLPDRAEVRLPEGNPYRGLQPFEAEHRGLFFGRGVEIRAVVDRLRGESIVVVAGDSGIGKSSLCRAGVGPAVLGGALDENRDWTVVSLVPGRAPLAALAAATASLLGADEVGLRRTFEEDPPALGRGLRRVAGEGKGILLFVDQLEELFTHAGAEEASRFAQTLGAIGWTGHTLRVLVTVRGDFVTRLASLPGLGDGLERSLFVLGALSPEGAREAVTGPARRKGVHFESDSMIEEIVSGASGAGGLPLCQFAMAELWDARDTTRAIIPERALLAVGGVAGALARHADGLLARLPDLQRDVARTLLLHLVTPEGTRARRTAIELGAFHGATETVLDALVRGRLVVAREVSGETSYEVAHEALLSGWHTLRDWLASDAGTRPLRERVERAAAEWERLGRPAELAWSERQLEQVRVLESGSLAGGSGEFLETSRRRATRRKWQRRGLIAIVPIVVPLVFLGLRLQAQRETDRAVARHAEAAAPLVENGKAARLRAEELRTKAFSLFDAVHGQTFEEAQTESDRAEERWAEALETGRTADTALAQGARALEAGLALDPSREDLRSSIGDVTVERLLLAEAFHQPEKRADLEEQLTGYDSDGSRRAHLATPPVLTLESTPPGADVTLERYVDRAGYRVLVGAKSLGKTPIAGHSLGDGPGSYRLTFVAGGRVEVRYPVLLGRGEEVRLSVDLPAKERIPEGLVYVPPGRFLYGSTDPEPLRRGFINTVPLHELRTEGFAIGRNEVTFAEWLDFLRALPPSERKVRMPDMMTREWGVQLEEDPTGAYRVVFVVSGERKVAGEGEMLSFPARNKRAEQDWRQFPVSGVSMEDAVAYVEWLAATGMVPGARLCTEYEWERAARGADDRVYPHGDAIRAEDANYDETYGRTTGAFAPDEIGSHPTSLSPFGLEDMAGNVLETVTSTRVEGEVLTRGGAAYFDRFGALVTNRTVAEPKTRDLWGGVRVCATAE